MSLHLTIQDAPEPHDVAVGVEEDAVGDHAVTPGSPRLLVVPLHRLGQRVVDDEADVSLVDTHTERDGGADHLSGGQRKAVSRTQSQ